MNLNLLYISGRNTILHDSLSLIYVATSLLNSIKFFRFRWFMVFCYLLNLTYYTLIIIHADARYSSAISNIDNVNVIINNHYHQGTTSRSVDRFALFIKSYLLQEVFFCLSRSLSDCLFDVFRV